MSTARQNRVNDLTMPVDAGVNRRFKILQFGVSCRCFPDGREGAVGEQAGRVDDDPGHPSPGPVGVGHRQALQPRSQDGPRYIARGLEPPAYGPRQPRPTFLDPFTGYLRDRVTAYPGLSGARLWRELKDRATMAGDTPVSAAICFPVQRWRGKASIRMTTASDVGRWSRCAGTSGLAGPQRPRP
jgi:hypothetical protein